MPCGGVHLEPHGGEEPEPDLLWRLVDRTSNWHVAQEILTKGMTVVMVAVVTTWAGVQ